MERARAWGQCRDQEDTRQADREHCLSPSPATLCLYVRPHHTAELELHGEYLGEGGQEALAKPFSEKICQDTVAIYLTWSKSMK